MDHIKPPKNLKKFFFLRIAPPKKIRTWDLNIFYAPKWISSLQTAFEQTENLRKIFFFRRIAAPAPQNPNLRSEDFLRPKMNLIMFKGLWFLSPTGDRWVLRLRPPATLILKLSVSHGECAAFRVIGRGPSSWCWWWWIWRSNHQTETSRFRLVFPWPHWEEKEEKSNLAWQRYGAMPQVTGNIFAEEKICWSDSGWEEDIWRAPAQQTLRLPTSFAGGPEFLATIPGRYMRHNNEAFWKHQPDVTWMGPCLGAFTGSPWPKPWTWCCSAFCSR